MDPFTAIGLASSIVQFVDYSTKLINGAREIYDSASGMTEENKSLESIVSEMKELSSKLLPGTSGPRSEDVKALCRVAAECNILSDQILELLGKIKPKAPKSKHQSAWAAVKNKIHEKDKLELEKRLGNCRSQLELQLNFLTSSETKDRLETLIRSAQGNDTKLEQLQNHMDQLRRGVTISSMSPKAQAQLRKLLDLSEEAGQIITQQRILKSLAFDNMHGRFEAVDTAHYQTFRWIFGDDPGVEDEDSPVREDGTPPRAEDLPRGPLASESFIHWLSSGKGVFHISGKLGSGKSTLMKFLCEHERTKAELQKWAGERKLVLANFFFWKPGTALQKSLSGLFRSLLHDVLKSCPDLIPVVLPNQWEEVKSMPWQVKTELDLGQKEIRAAFSRLIRNRNLYEKHCFCFFIDGLDEYEETRQEDYKVMVEQLCSWTVTAPEDVKICVSSREYNVFLNAFSNERRLRLQDLTRGDMDRYIRDKLKGLSDKNLEHLVRLITDKGNGIFLWVALVVKTLRERLEDGHEFSALEKEIESLPDELEDLFEYLLKSIGKTARRRVYQIFGMILKLQPYELDLTLLSYSFLEDYENDLEFAMRTSFSHSNMSDTVQNSRIDLARRRVNGYCRGFLESSQNESALDFVHRSIPEFLEKPEVQKDMEFHLRDFNLIDAISQLLLAEIRSKKQHSIHSYSLSLTVYVIIDLRSRNKTDQAPYPFLECLQTSALLHGISGPGCAGISLRVSQSGQVFVGRPTDTSNYLTSPLEVSAFLGDWEYTTWKIENDPTTIDTDYKAARLLCWIEMGSIYNGRLVNFKLVDFLLRRGLPPQRVIHNNAEITLLDISPELSFWQHFIFLITFHGSRIQGQGNGSRQALGEVIETFLHYGADPQLIISIPDQLHDSIITSSMGTYRSKRDIQIEFGREAMKMVKVGFTVTPELQFIVKQGGKASLRDLIEFWAFDNQETILELFDRNLEVQDQISEIQDCQQQSEEKGTTQELESPGPESTLQLESDVALKETEQVREVRKAGESVTALTQDFKGFGSWFEPANWSPVITFWLGILLAIFILRLL